MPTTIKHKIGSGAPLASDLVEGELGIDTVNGRVYTENSVGSIVELGANPAGEIQANAGIALPDSQKATFGASDDLQIYHNGTDSYIDDVGTGNLNIRGENIILRKTNGEAMVACNVDSSVDIYYDNSKKLATTSTGIDVTGTVTADGLTVNATQVTLSNDGSNYFLAERTTVGTEGRLFMGVTSSKNQIVSYSGTSGTAGKDLTIEQGNAIGTAVRVAANNDISFYEDTGTTAKFFWDASAESLGIGTTSPAREVHVVGAGFFGSATAGVTLGENAGIASVYGLNAAGTTYYPLELRTGASGTGLYQDTSGNVGIGTTTPSSILETFGGDGITISNSGDTFLQLKTTGTTATNYIEFKDSGGGVGSIFYNHTSNYLATKVNGSERMRIDSSGNVGIGTASPAVKTHAYISAATNEVMRIEQGTSARGAQINFKNPHNSSVYLGISGDSSGDLISYNGAATNQIFYTNASERMRIDSSGNLLVGTTSTIAGGKISAQATSSNPAVTAQGASDCFQGRTTQTSGTSYFAYWVYNGTAVGSITSTGSSTAYNTSSDYRLKEDIQDIVDASSSVLALKPCNFAWKSDGSRVNGFIAHELQEVVPEAVHGTKDAMRTEEYEVSPAVPAEYDEEGNVITEAVPAVMGTREVPDYQGIDQSKLVPLLTKALQEALTEIESLKARVSALEN